MDNLKYIPFANIDINDSFFDSLRDSYEGFNDWFAKKSCAGAAAWVYYDDSDKLCDFLYLKDETEQLNMDTSALPQKRRLKIGTFKIERRGTNRGERFIKKILDTAILGGYMEVYVTLFDDTEELLHLKHFLEKYGFIEVGSKTNPAGRCEKVMLRDMSRRIGNTITDYPYVATNDGFKYVLSIYPEYHTKLFSDSMLTTEKYDILQDVSETNSIYKLYLCWMKDVAYLRPNDKLIIYRTSDYQGPAYYRSVATSLCTVLEVKTNHDFGNVDEFTKYCNKYSVFEEKDLRKCFSGKTCFVIKMMYNVAFPSRVIRKNMIEEIGIPSDMYWGFFRLSDNQFYSILSKGEVDERYIIN